MCIKLPPSLGFPGQLTDAAEVRSRDKKTKKKTKKTPTAKKTGAVKAARAENRKAKAERVKRKAKMNSAGKTRPGELSEEQWGRVYDNWGRPGGKQPTPWEMDALGRGQSPWVF